MLKSASRGQTMPFWLVAIVILLSLTFFGANYMNMIAWQMRAQNAADAAAATVLSPSTNVLNQESTMLYAQAVNEYRLRYLNQSILNAINSVGCAKGAGCQGIYSRLLPEYNAALAAYNDMNQTIQEAQNYTTGGQIAADEKAAKALLGNTVSDPAFTYTVFDSSTVSGKGNKGAIRQTDVGACANVSFFTPLLLNLSSGSSFTAFGRAAAISIPKWNAAAAPAGWFLASGYSEYFSPAGTGVTNPLTGAAYQPPEDPAGTNAGYFTTDFSSLTVGLSWWVSNVIKPYKGVVVAPGDYSCS